MIEKLILTGSSSLEELNWSETLGPETETPTVEILDPGSRYGHLHEPSRRRHRQCERRSRATRRCAASRRGNPVEGRLPCQAHVAQRPKSATRQEGVCGGPDVEAAHERIRRRAARFEASTSASRWVRASMNSHHTTCVQRLGAMVGIYAQRDGV